MHSGFLSELSWSELDFPDGSGENFAMSLTKYQDLQSHAERT